MKGFPDLPPIWLLGFCLLAWVFGWALPLVDLAGPVLRGLGALCSLGGVALIVWSGMWFMRKKTTIEPHETPTVLIVEGPYRLSRNPIYLGMVIILIGVALWQGALSGLVLPVIFILLISKRFIEPEEAALRSEFGAAAETFMASTRRWL